MPRLPVELQPFVPTPADPFDSAKAAHLLNRAGFGGTREEIARVVELGPEAAVDLLLDFPNASADELSKTDVPDLSAIDAYPRTFAERRKLLTGLTPQERQELNQKLMQANREAIFTIVHWWLDRMARLTPGGEAGSPLHEKLVLFWHGHFTTSARDERSAWLMWQQNETLRRHAAGNFTTFVKQISRDPAMLDYLNNQQNRKGRPNENYARELMELFTLGIGNYTENDIKEAARAFTGWGHDGDDFIFRENQHDFDEKTFFGLRGNFNGDDIIDIIMKHRACGNYIASRLWSFFVTESIKPEHAAALGSLLREERYELRPLLRTILTSKAFYSADAIGTQIKSPVQLVVGTVRTLGIKMPERRELSRAFEQMGQVPFFPPNVKGWPGGRHWINTSTLFVRVNTAIQLVSKLNDRELIPAEFRNDGPGLSRFWVERLVQRRISEDRQGQLNNVVGRVPSIESARRLLEAVVSLPEFQLC